MNIVTKTIANYIEENKKCIICFDLFDTLISRRFSPEEVKKTWALKCCEEYDLSISWSDLYSIRLKNETILYNDSSINYEFEYSQLMRRVFAEISYELFVSLEEFIAFSLSCETEIEKNVQYLNKDLYETLLYCKKVNAKVIVVSDFYFGRLVIVSFLKKHGILELIDKVFVSSDKKKSKRKGDIYEVIRESYPNEKLLMIGDNYRADYKEAVNKGLDAFWLDRTKQHKEYAYFDNYPKKYINKCFSKITKEGSFLSNYAFTLFLFCEKLFYEIKKEKISDLYFLSRDGEFLKELFDIYIDLNPLKENVKTHYLLVSRSATFLAGCGPIESEDFKALFNQYKNISIGDFLESLSFTQSQIDDILNTYSDSTMNDIKDELFKDEVFKKYYENNRKSRKQGLKLYLKQEIVDFNTINLVDVGWKGTIQDNIFRALDSKHYIRGLYYGLTDCVNQCENNVKKGLMFDTNSLDNLYSFDCWFIENILTGSHAKVKSYLAHEKKVEIEYEKDSDSVLYELYIRELRKEIINKFTQLAILFCNSHYNTSDNLTVFEKNHFSTTRFFPFKQMKQNYIIRMLHSESFGVFQSKYQVSKKGYVKYFFKEYGWKYMLYVYFQYIKRFGLKSN